MKTTRWFPGSVAPVHVGWYERMFTTLVCRWYWNGRAWQHPHKRRSSKLVDSYYQPPCHIPWRGVAVRNRSATAYRTKRVKRRVRFGFVDTFRFIKS